MSTPRPELLSFLEAIKENPVDDTPRLIFADWLEEHDDPRGELVRVQCQLERMMPEKPRFQEPGQRVRDLIDLHGREWLQPIAELGSDWEFRRGLLQCRLALSERPTPRTAAVQQAWAWVEAVRYSGPIARLAALAPLLLSAVPHLRLTTSNEAGSDLAEFLAVPERRCLHELEINGTVLHREEVVALAASPYYSRLASLILVRNRLGPEGAETLAAAHFPRLRWLRLAGNRLGASGAAALARSILLQKLTVLDLQANRLEAEGTRELAASPFLTNLEYLGLGSNRLGVAGAAALASSPFLGKLTALDLSDNALGDGGAAALAMAPWVRNLQVLKLGDNRLTPAGEEALRRSSHWHGALRLDLGNTQIAS